MKKIIKLTETDLYRIVKKVLNEQGSADVNVDLLNKKQLSQSELKYGNTGDNVKKLQQALMDIGLLKTDTMVPTGYFGDKTQSALKQFQTMKRIPATGVFNELTKSLLFVGGFDNYKKSSTTDSVSNPKLNNVTGKGNEGLFVDCVKNSPKKQMLKTKSGNSIILIDGHYFYGNGKVRKPDNQMATYFCYEDGVKIKTDDGEKTYLDTGVKTSHEETSRFSGGIGGFLRKTFPNVAEIFDTKPLTGKDFTESQKEVIFNVIQNAIAKRKQDRKKGCTEYIDYSPEIDQQLNKKGGASTIEMVLGSGFSDEFRVATTLGRFCYELQPNGNYLVKDDYDFHKWASFTVKPEEVNGMSYPQKIGYIMYKTGLGPYGAIRHIGYLEHPDNAPAATKTRIVLNIDPGYYAKQEKPLRADIGKLGQDKTAMV